MWCRENLRVLLLVLHTFTRLYTHNQVLVLTMSHSAHQKKNQGWRFREFHSLSIVNASTLGFNPLNTLNFKLPYRLFDLSATSLNLSCTHLHIATTLRFWKFSYLKKKELFMIIEALLTHKLLAKLFSCL